MQALEYFSWATSSGLAGYLVVKLNDIVSREKPVSIRFFKRMSQSLLPVNSSDTGLRPFPRSKAGSPSRPAAPRLSCRPSPHSLPSRHFNRPCGSASDVPSSDRLPPQAPRPAAPAGALPLHYSKLSHTDWSPAYVRRQSGVCPVKAV